MGDLGACDNIKMDHYEIGLKYVDLTHRLKIWARGGLL
jgi:hypothetical protein